MPSQDQSALAGRHVPDPHVARARVVTTTRREAEPVRAEGQPVDRSLVPFQSQQWPAVAGVPETNPTHTGAVAFSGGDLSSIGAKGDAGEVAWPTDQFEERSTGAEIPGPKHRPAPFPSRRDVAKVAASRVASALKVRSNRYAEVEPRFGPENFLSSRAP